MGFTQFAQAVHRDSITFHTRRVGVLVPQPWPHQLLSVSVILVSRRCRSLSDCRCCSILAMECMTVVWCLPPNWRPISGNEASVICLARYMATCRGKTMARELLLVLI